MIATNNEPYARFEIWTPDAAKQALEANTKNRKLYDMTVSLYAREMKNGNWSANGESIKFDASGRLVDGQHRLNAIVRSNTNQSICTVRNLPPEDSTFTTIDSGMKRTTASVLAMDGVSSSPAVASIILFDYKVKNKIMRSTKYVLSTQAIVQIYRNNPERWNLIREYADSVCSFLRRPPYGAFAELALSKCEQSFQLWHDSLRNGTGLDAGHPILSLRNYLINRNAEKATNNEQIRLLQFNACVSAWNAWRENRKLNTVRPKANIYNTNII